MYLNNQTKKGDEEMKVIIKENLPRGILSMVGAEVYASENSDALSLGCEDTIKNILDLDFPSDATMTLSPDETTVLGWRDYDRALTYTRECPGEYTTVGMIFYKKKREKDN